MINIPTNIYEDFHGFRVYAIVQETKSEKTICRHCLGSGAIISEDLIDVPCPICSGTGTIEEYVKINWKPIKTPGRIVEISSGEWFDERGVEERGETIFIVEFPSADGRSYCTLSFPGANVFFTLDAAISECNKRNSIW